MLQNPMSAATSPRPDACHTNVQASAGSLLGVGQRRPRSTDRHLLALLGEHQVLTTTQLVRLALWRMPADEHDRRLVEVLTDLSGARR